MELPNVGVHCYESTCHRLDFLPVKCDACKNSFCKDHMSYAQHKCAFAQSKNVQVPVCPLCNNPVPSPRGQAPDIAVGDHIDRDCQSDPAQKQRKAKRNKCNVTTCKIKEIVPILCSNCNLNFCLKHRFAEDHQCKGIKGRAANAAVKRFTESRNTSQSLSHKVQGVMSEDEALARALQESMRDTRQTVPPAGGGQNGNCKVS